MKEFNNQFTQVNIISTEAKLCMIYKHCVLSVKMSQRSIHSLSLSLSYALFLSYALSLFLSYALSLSTFYQFIFTCLSFFFSDLSIIPSLSIILSSDHSFFLSISYCHFLSIILHSFSLTVRTLE